MKQYLLVQQHTPTYSFWQIFTYGSPLKSHKMHENGQVQKPTNSINDLKILKKLCLFPKYFIGPSNIIIVLHFYQEVEVDQLQLLKKILIEIQNF